MSPVLPTPRAVPFSFRVAPPSNEVAARDEGDIAASISIQTDASSATASILTNGLSLSSTSPRPTARLPLEINEKDIYYETLSVTLPFTTYTTTILLGNSFPTSDLQPTTYPAPTMSSNTKVQTPGIPTGTIVGIVVGLVVGFLALFGVFYVYLLRAEQAKRIRRRRSRRGSSATADAAAPPAAPPAEG